MLFWHLTLLPARMYAMQLGIATKFFCLEFVCVITLEMFIFRFMDGPTQEVSNRSFAAAWKTLMLKPMISSRKWGKLANILPSFALPCQSVPMARSRTNHQLHQRESVLKTEWKELPRRQGWKWRPKFMVEGTRPG